MSLANALFQPLFPWSSQLSADANMLEELLDEFHDANPRKEALLRSIIGTTATRDGEERKRKAITLIRDDVADVCKPILTLSQPGRSTEFKRSLEQFLLNAVDIWNLAQTQRSRVLATSEVEDTAGLWEGGGKFDLEWDGRGEHDALGQTEHQVDAVPVKALYPRLYQSTENQKTLVYAGCALWSNQELYVAGKREYRIQARRINSVPRRLNVSPNPAGIGSHMRTHTNTDSVSTRHTRSNKKTQWFFPVTT
jgi:hypothetical protein